MPRLSHRSNAHFVTALAITCLSLLLVPCAAASDKNAAKDSSSANAAADGNAKDVTDAGAKAPTVLYAAFDGAFTSPVEPPPEHATRPRSVNKLLASVGLTKSSVAVPVPMPAPSPRPSPAVSTAPMTVGEKFGSWFRGQFLSFGSYGSAVFNGLWKELQDNDDFKEDTTENYFADSMTRAARSFTFGATSGFYEKAVLASLFKQDPRYHRSDKKGFAKLTYAATRVFITQGDRCGCDQFN